MTNKSPPPPGKPSAHECCGSGCVPCIFDYYYEALEKWQSEHASTTNQDESRYINGDQAKNKIGIELKLCQENIRNQLLAFVSWMYAINNQLRPKLRANIGNLRT